MCEDTHGNVSRRSQVCGGHLWLCQPLSLFDTVDPSPLYLQPTEYHTFDPLLAPAAPSEPPAPSHMVTRVSFARLHCA